MKENTRKRWDGFHPAAGFRPLALTAISLFLAIPHCSAQSREASRNQVRRCHQGSPTARLAETIRVITWNIERGIEYPGIVDFLRQAKADILLLQEVDANARRSGGRFRRAGAI